MGRFRKIDENTDFELPSARVGDLVGDFVAEIEADFARFTGLERHGLLANHLLSVALDDGAHGVGGPLGAGRQLLGRELERRVS